MVPVMLLLFMASWNPRLPSPLSHCAPPLATHAFQRMQFLSSVFGVAKQLMLVVGDCVGAVVA